ncbi:hypothetical protein D3C85_1333830 [compost metagenome]
MLDDRQHILFAVAGIAEHFLDVGGMDAVFTGQVVVRIGTPAAAVLHRLEVAMDQGHQRHQITCRPAYLGQLKC